MKLVITGISTIKCPKRSWKKTGSIANQERGIRK
jgi:hypothetical protein